VTVDLNRPPRPRYTVVVRDQDGNHVLSAVATRRGQEWQYVRREPEPILDAWAQRQYEGKMMGNNVYLWDFKSMGNGKVSVSLEPIEHRVADGPAQLIKKLMEWVIW
jgi:hypothetical protein